MSCNIETLFGRLKTLRMIQLMPNIMLSREKFLLTHRPIVVASMVRILDTLSGSSTLN